MDKLAEFRELLLNDVNFRKLLRTEPKLALEKADIRPTPQNLALVQNVIDSIDNLYEGFGEIHQDLT